MMASSKIQWTDETWNPVTGCSRVSEGCRNCYIERTPPFRMAGRKLGDPVQLHPDRLDAPLHWKKPRRVFVDSLSDLFHEDVPINFIASVFNIMASATTSCHKRHVHQEECWDGEPHTFQILTKRPARMNAVLDKIPHFISEWWPGDAPLCTAMEVGNWPLPNVLLGVSVEDQKTADKRIPILLRTPAAVRWISAEPLLGPVDLTAITVGHENWNALDRREAMDAEPGSPNTILDWVVLGGESGPQARPCNVDWIRSLVQQCRSETIPVFVKQVGSRPWSGPGNHPMHITDPKGGDPSEWPTDLRVREWPQ